MSNSFIPILFLTYNRLELTKQAFASLVTYTLYRPIRIFIIDNNSTDGTKEWLKQVEKNNPIIENIVIEKIAYLDKNIGVVGAINLFLDMISSFECKYIAKVDNDTIVPEGWLIKLVELMDKTNMDVIQLDHPLAFLATKGCIKEYNNRKLYYDTLKTLYEDKEGKIVEFNSVGGSAVIIKRDYIKKIPESNAPLQGWVEYQMAIKGKKGIYTGITAKLLDMKDRITSNNIVPYKDEWLEYSESLRKLTVSPPVITKKDGTQVIQVWDGGKWIAKMVEKL